MATPRKVLVLALDGTRIDIFHDCMFEKANAPNFKFLCDNGKYVPCTSLDDENIPRTHDHNNERNKYGPNGFKWETAPGWCSVVTGVDSNKHQVKNNAFSSQEVFTTTSKTYPTCFSIAKTKGLRTAATGTPCFLSARSKWLVKKSYGIIDFECGVESMAGVHHLKVRSKDVKSDNLDYRLSHQPGRSERDQDSATFAINHISNGTADVLFAHFDTIDGAGHSKGFGSADYINAISNVDSLISPIIDVIKAQENEDWLVIVTSDHGGVLKDHDFSYKFDTAVPFVVCLFRGGKPASNELTDLVHPVRHMDTTPTLLHWMGVDISAYDMDGRVQCINTL